MLISAVCHNYHYRLTSRLIECKHLLFVEHESFFKAGYVCRIPKGVERNRVVLSLQSLYYAMILLVVMKWVIILQ